MGAIGGAGGAPVSSGAEGAVGRGGYVKSWITG